MKRQNKRSNSLNWGLATKLVIATTFLSLSSLILLALTVNFASTQELENQISERLETRAQLEANRIGNLLAEQVELVQTIVSSDPQIISAFEEQNSSYIGTDSEIEAQLIELDNIWREAEGTTSPLIENTINNPMSDQLRLFIQHFPAHAEIFFTDQYGAEIAGSGRTSDYYQADEEWWQAGWNDGKGSVHFGSPQLDDSAGIVAIDITVPVWHPETNEVIGIVKTVYDIGALIEDVEQFTLGETGQASVFDKQGRFVVGPTLDNIGQDVPASLLLNGDVFQSDGYDLNAVDLDGQPVVVGFATVTTARDIEEVNQMGWVIRVEQDATEAFAPVNQLQSVAALYTLLAGLVAAVVAFIMSRSLTRNLLALTEVSQMFGEGKFDVRTDIDSLDEIGQLAQTFNQMATSVQDRIAEAEAARVQAEYADNVKSAFLASISHELRTPLNAVINFSQFVAKGIMGPINDKQQETLLKVVASGKHLLTLINDVLDMSKIEAGSLKLFVEDNIDVNQIVTDVAGSAESLLLDSGVTISVDKSDNLPTIRGDKKRINQIVTNIMSNACKFTEEGSINIQTSHTHDNVTITVKDTGSGIAAEDHESVFEAFKQTNNGLRQGDGTGLGLPISRSLIEAHGGSLSFESAVGEGTTFYIILPILPDHLEVTLI